MELRPLSLEDAEVIRQERNNLSPGILRTPYMLTKEMQEDWYYREIANRDSRTRYWGLIGETSREQPDYVTGEKVHYTAKKLVGYGGIENIDWVNRSGEMSLLVFTDYRCQGFGQNAVKLFLSEAFNTLNLETVYAEVFECNPNLQFWAKIAAKNKEPVRYLPRRKYLNGTYYGSYFYTWTKEDM